MTTERYEQTRELRAKFKAYLKWYAADERYRCLTRKMEHNQNKVAVAAAKAELESTPEAKSPIPFNDINSYTLVNYLYVRFSYIMYGLLKGRTREQIENRPPQFFGATADWWMRRSESALREIMDKLEIGDLYVLHSAYVSHEVKSEAVS